MPSQSNLNGAAKRFKTGPQIVVSPDSSAAAGAKAGIGILEVSGRSSQTERRFKAMLVDPTIKLAIDVILAMLKRHPWNVEGENPQHCEFVEKQVMPYRDLLIMSSFFGLLQDGWRTFETVFEVKEALYAIAGVKPLRTSDTIPLAYEDTGAFAGVENTDTNDQVVRIDERHVIFINFDEDGFGDLGRPLLKTAEGPFIKWEACDEGAQRYDKKVAGGFLFIQYPVGATAYSRRGGALTDNAEIMEDLAKRVESAGYGGVPVTVDPETGKIEDGPWKIEHISAGGGLQPNFVTRAKYLDALKLRAFGIPERSTTEGTFGTKAEAEAHADIAIIVNMDRHARIIDSINKYLLEPLNTANWGNPQECRLVLGKLDPADRELFAQIFTGLMTDPLFGNEIAGRVDMDALLDKLNVPVKPVQTLLKPGVVKPVPQINISPGQNKPEITI